jgi:hypothetical protein
MQSHSAKPTPAASAVKLLLVAAGGRAGCFMVLQIHDRQRLARNFFSFSRLLTIHQSGGAHFTMDIQVARWAIVFVQPIEADFEHALRTMLLPTLSGLMECALVRPVLDGAGLSMQTHGCGLCVS